MKVLSVDDNPQNRAIIERALHKDFDVVSSDGNEDILPLMERVQPEIVLLDIMLEGKSGFDLCKQIRDSQHNDVLIIFISALNSVDDKLKAYGVGGDDYVCKPVEIAELRQKLLGAQKRIDQKKLLAAQLQDASQAAFSSMQQASELGEVIAFFNDTLAITDADALFAKLQQHLMAMGYSCSAEFRMLGDKTTYPKELDSTLELEILELGRSAKRIVPFGANLLFNSPHCSFIVKGLAFADEDLLGRLRDSFAILLNILDSRIMFIASRLATQKERQKAIASLRDQLSQDFTYIKALSQKQEERLQQIVDETMSEFDTKMIIMGLDEEQESELMGLFDNAREKLNETVGVSMVIDNKFRDIDNLLNKIE